MAFDVAPEHGPLVLPTVPATRARSRVALVTCAFLSGEPAAFAEPGDRCTPPAAGDWVIKPNVSCGARDTGLYKLPAQNGLASAHVDRADLIPGPGGAPMLVELELTEPSLFLSEAPGAASRLAEGILARI